MIKLNLLPDIKREYIKTRRLQARVISAAILAMIISAGLVVVTAFIVYGAQKLQINMLTSSIKESEQKLASIKDIEKYVTVQNQLTQIDQLHATKNIYSRIFDVVSHLNPKAPNNVTISSLVVSGSDTTINFKGETASYTGLETFRDTLKNAKVEFDGNKKEEALFDPASVSILSQALSVDTSGKAIVTFEISASYHPQLFSRSVKSYAISVPTMETTQTKQDAPDVFGESTVKQEGNN